MNIWEILELEETKDEDKIKKAYRDKLAVTNPEDDAEGFKALRKAYDEAIYYANSQDDTEGNKRKDELDEHTKALSDLYNNFYERINPDNWLKILKSDYYVSLDTSERAFYGCIRFLMDNYTLPHEVWEVIVNTYDIEVRKDELKEHIPANFLDYVIANGKYNDPFSYAYFKGENDADYDKFIDTLYQLEKVMKQGEIEKQDELLNNISEFKIYHPEIEIFRTRNYLQKEDIDAAEECISKAYENYPDYSNVCSVRADIYITREDDQNAKELLNKVLENDPDNYGVRVKLGNILVREGEFNKAKDIFVELMNINHYDNAVRNFMMTANNGLIEQYKKDLEDIANNQFDIDAYIEKEELIKKAQKKKDGKEDEIENNAINIDKRDINYIQECIKMEIAWCYYQNYNIEEGIKLLNELEPSDSEKCSYYNVKGRMYLILDEMKEALQLFTLWKNEIERLIEAYGEDSEYTDINNITKRYGYAVCNMGMCYLRLKDYENARKYIEKAIGIEHKEKSVAFELRCELEYQVGNYQEALKATDELLKIDADNYLAISLKAQSYYMIGNYNEAMVLARNAINIYPFAIEPYEVMLKIYSEYDELEEMQDVIEEYEQFEIPCDTVKLYKAIILYKEKENDKALSILKELEQVDEKETDLKNKEEVYRFLGNIYDRIENYDEALKANLNLYKINPNHDRVNGFIGMSYYGLNKLEMALQYFDKQLEIRDMPIWQLYKGMTCRAKGDIISAKEAFLKVYDYDPEQYDITYRLVNICMMLQQYDETEFFVKKHIEINGDYENAFLVLECLPRIKMIKKDYENALNEYVELNKKFDNRFVNIYAELLGRMGRGAEALKFLKDYINRFDQGVSENSVNRCISMYIEIAMESGYSTKVMDLFSGKRAKLIGMNNRVEYYVGLYNCEKYRNKLKSIYKAPWVLEQKDAMFLLKMADFFDSMLIKDKAYIEQLKEKGKSCIDDSFIPYDRLMTGFALYVDKKYNESIKVYNDIIEGPLCTWCCYNGCHEAWYQKGLVYERMHMYGEALNCYKKALNICGVNKLYMKKIKKLEKKL